VKTPALSLGNATAAQESGSLVFTVKLSARSVKRITVRYATSDGSAAAGTSYSATRGTLAFKPGQRVGRIRVPLIQSSTPSAAGTFYLGPSVTDQRTHHRRTGPGNDPRP
jgi:Calx-beta domain